MRVCRCRHGVFLLLVRRGGNPPLEGPDKGFDSVCKDRFRFFGRRRRGRGSSMRIRGTRVSPRCRALYSARVGRRSESFLGTRSFSPARTLSSRTASSLARSMVRGDTPYLPAMNATDSPLRTECSTHGRELAEAAGEKKRTARTEKSLKERTRKRNAGKKAQNRPLR